MLDVLKGFIKNLVTAKSVEYYSRLFALSIAKFIKQQRSYWQLTWRSELFRAAIFSMYSLFHIPLSWMDTENVNIQPSFIHFGIQS